MASDFPHLFSPYSMGNVQLKNRLVLLAHGTRMVQDALVGDQLIQYINERAKGGVGLIIVDMAPNDISEANVSQSEKRDPLVSHLGIWKDDQISGLQKLVAVIHSAGAKASAQIELHPLWTAEKGGRLEGVGASDEPASHNSPKIRAATLTEIQQIITEHVEAVIRARKAGFDMVEFMAGIGYFLSRFLSSRSNQRIDAYGGSLENRTKILLEIIEKTRQEVGSDYAISCRISADEFVEGGNTLTDTRQIARMLEKAGIAAIDVEAGRHDSPKPLVQQWVAPGSYVYLAEEIKKEVQIPVISAYRIVDPSLAEEIVSSGKADFVGMVRALIADPEFPNKAKKGQVKEIRRCIACCHCLDVAITFESLTCSINASVGKELEPIKPVSQSRHILVIGGGPSGMEAARIAALRGHNVTLCEQNRRLGGLMVLGSVLNRELAPFLNWLKRQVGNLPVDIRTKTKATSASLQEMRPDVVILATGGIPLPFEVPSVNRNNVFKSHDFLNLVNGKHIGKGVLLRLAAPLAKYFSQPSIMRKLMGFNFPIKKKVVIIGGQFAGCELALTLVEKGKQVTIIEESNRIGADIGITSRWVEMAMLRNAGTKMLTNTSATEITERGIMVNHEGSVELIEADTVLVAQGKGVQANPKLIQELQTLALDFFVVGDCAEPGKLQKAIASGYDIGSKI